MEALLDALLPQRCQLCTAPVEGHRLCAGCHRDLPWLERSCPRCALPLSENEHACGSCLRRPPSFDGSWAAFLYRPPIDHLVNQFKNRRRLASGALLADLWLERTQPGRPDAVTYVPLHWRRQLFRGFNQAAFVARRLAREMGLPTVPTADRSRFTSKQQQLTRRQRLRNMREAFTVYGELDGLDLALVDDVVTTGATVEALARQLKRAGARRVEVWTLARTPEAQ